MLSAVIVTYHSASCIAECLVSVRRGFADVEIVVVDNASQDETAEVALAVAEGVRVIRLGENVGFGSACNIGAEAARGSHVMFVNPDTRVGEVDSGAFSSLLEHRPFGLVAPWLSDDPERHRVDPHWLRELVLHTAGMLRPRGWQPPRIRRPACDESGWVSAALLVVARDEFLALGGFDSRFFLYYEDRDLSHRYRRAGLPVTTTSAVRGTHHGGASSADDGLRAVPIGWGLLGWIQYVALHRGLRAARRCAQATLVVLRGMRAVLAILEATRWRRARRKAEQLDLVLTFLGRRAESQDRRYCPDALTALTAGRGWRWLARRSTART